MKASVSTPAAMSPGMGNLSEQYHHIIEAMAQGLKLEAIAHQLQVSLETLYRWLGEPLFRTMLQQRQFYQQEQAQLKMAEESSNVVDRLIAQTESSHVSIQLRAINMFLRLVKANRTASSASRSAKNKTPSADNRRQPKLDAPDVSATASQPPDPPDQQRISMPALSVETPTHDPLTLSDESPTADDHVPHGTAAPGTRSMPEPAQNRGNRRERRKQQKRQQKRNARR
ncbi:MAG: hypothetical protein HC837_01460 [Chloroflexaceae bacterium]|nr:hypothetical protein [Chloroflexaceae bacterium]